MKLSKGFVIFNLLACCVYFLFACRKDFKFNAVEAQDPYKNSIDDWKKELDSLKAEAKPEFVLINSPAPFVQYANRFPTVDEFDAILKTTGDYVQALNVRKVHLMLPDIKSSDQM